MRPFEMGSPIGALDMLELNSSNFVGQGVLHIECCFLAVVDGVAWQSASSPGLQSGIALG